MNNNEVYDNLCNKFEQLNENDKNVLLIYKSALSYHINEISLISDIENKDSIEIFDCLKNRDEFIQRFKEYKNILEQPENFFIRYSIFSSINFENIVSFIASLKKIYDRIIKLFDKIKLTESCLLYRGFSYDTSNIFLAKGNIVSTSLSIESVEDFLFYSKNSVLYELSLNKNVNVLVIPYSIKRIKKNNKIFLKIEKNDSQKEVILFKPELFFELKNKKYFEEDNLTVEKYNVFSKNEKNNKLGVKNR